jgi:hypothetical protein
VLVEKRHSAKLVDTMTKNPFLPTFRQLVRLARVETKGTAVTAIVLFQPLEWSPSNGIRCNDSEEDI